MDFANVIATVLIIILGGIVLIGEGSFFVIPKIFHVHEKWQLVYKLLIIMFPYVFLSVLWRLWDPFLTPFTIFHACLCASSHEYMLDSGSRFSPIHRKDTGKDDLCSRRRDLSLRSRSGINTHPCFTGKKIILSPSPKIFTSESEIGINTHGADCFWISRSSDQCPG